MSDNHEAELEVVIARLNAFGFMSSETADILHEKPFSGPGNSKLKDAIALFQKFYRLPITKELDHETLKLLGQTRCGIPDPVGPPALLSDTGKWPQRRVTYQILNDHENVNGTVLHHNIQNAFSAWAEKCNLFFVEVESDALIQISFGRQEHGDGFPFAGKLGDLAHAFYPSWVPTYLAGDIHFDADESWSVEEICPTGMHDFFSVALHEIGHALGLEHTSDRDAVMYAYYDGPKRQLLESDITRIQQKYGS